MNDAVKCNIYSKFLRNRPNIKVHACILHFHANINTIIIKLKYKTRNKQVTMILVTFMDTGLLLIYDVSLIKLIKAI